MNVEAVRGTLYAATPLHDRKPEAVPIYTFGSPVFQKSNRADRFVRRLEAHECWGYWVNNEVASYFWLTRGPALVPLWRGVQLEITQDVLYVWDCRTWEPYQRRGWYTRALRDARSMSESSSIWIACDDENVASASVIQRQFSPLQKYSLCKIGPLYFRGIIPTRVIRI
jgi:hypothetical protein